MAAFVPGDLAGRAWPISTSAIVMGVRDSGGKHRRRASGGGQSNKATGEGWRSDLHLSHPDSPANSREKRAMKA
jgi:hypothetical protein